MGEQLPADERGAEVEEGRVRLGAALVADEQAAGAVQPREAPFGYPAVPAEPPAPERLLFFSDAVIAIAMTLLALELPVPVASSALELVEAFSGPHGREYLAFLVAFVLIATNWMAHHALFSDVVGTDNWLLGLNLVGLFAFVLVPWATKSLGTAPGGPGLAVFSGVMTILVGSISLVAGHAARAGLLRPDAPDDLMRRIWIITGPPTVMFAVSVPLALIGWEFVAWSWPLVYVALALYLRRRIVGS